VYLGAKRRYINTLPFLSFPSSVFQYTSDAGESAKAVWMDGTPTTVGSRWQFVGGFSGSSYPMKTISRF